jgi:hypothetical protein
MPGEMLSRLPEKAFGGDERNNESFRVRREKVVVMLCSYGAKIISVTEISPY